MRLNHHVSVILRMVLVVIYGCAFYFGVLYTFVQSRGIEGEFTFTAPVALQPANELITTDSAHVAVRDVLITSTAESFSLLRDLNWPFFTLGAVILFLAILLTHAKPQRRRSKTRR